MRVRGTVDSVRSAPWVAATRSAGVVILVALASFAGGALITQLHSGRFHLTRLAILGLAAGVAIIVAGPAWCMAAIAVLVFSSLDGIIMTLGLVDVRLSDPFYVALVAWTVVLSVHGPRPRPAGGERRISVPLYALLPFLAVAGLSLWKVAIVDPAQFNVSLVSWIRLVQTASLAWLAALTLRSEGQVRLVLRAAVGGGLLAVGLAYWWIVVIGGNSILTGRWGGYATPNELGLISGLLILASRFRFVARPFVVRFPIALLGVLGLVLSKSIGAIVATAVALGLKALYDAKRKGTRLDRALKLSLIVVVFGLFAVAGMGLLRPESVPGSAKFSGSTTFHRIVLTNAGWEVFAQDPLIGVGWQRSSSPAVIGEERIVLTLQDRLGGFKPGFSPDVNPSSVHNAYLQALADLGLVGFGFLVFAIVQIGKGVRKFLRGLDPGSPTGEPAFFLSIGLVLVLLWWNDTPFFGGQIESVSAAIFLGALAALSRLRSSAANVPRHPWESATGWHRRSAAALPRG
jgi:O-antigen ligase